MFPLRRTRTSPLRPDRVCNRFALSISVSNEQGPRPVFYDGIGWRRHFVSAAGWAAFSIIGVLVACLIATSIDPPTMSGIVLGEAPRSLYSDPGFAPSSRNEPGIRAAQARSASERVAARALRYGHLVAWDDKGLASLQKNAHRLDVVIGEWLSLVDPSGGLNRADQEHEATARAWLTRHAPTVKIYPHVNNYNRATQAWVADTAAAVLASPAASQRFVNDLVDYLTQGSFPGVVLDIEQLPPASRRDYTALVRSLSRRLREHGVQLVVQVPVWDAAYDYTELAAAADAVIVMTYDEHIEKGAAGPIAGQGWFESQIQQAVRLIGRDKLIVGIGSYGYDWAGFGKGREISVREAWDLLGETGSQLHVDARSLNPTFTYRVDKGNEQHQVWFLDATTVYNQVAAALVAEPAGLSLWRLGSEDPAVWDSFGRGRKSDADALAEIRTISMGGDVIYKGEGEVLSASGEPRPGQRTLTYDKVQNLITHQTITRLPTSTVVTRRGARTDKVIALTFDDGPDPIYTPQILDILTAKDVKATFFVLGSASVVNADLLARIYRDGHDIGNHTFSHLNSSAVPSEYLRIELNATQRLLEAQIGVRTRLFRPPYARDIEPRTIEAAEALKVSASLGYLTIGMKIDPKDWMLPLPRQITQRTIEAVRRGDGNVVLLHDAGGVRTSTIKALPEIIDTLRAEGYRFVTIHELMGLTRSDLMPPIAGPGSLVATLNFAGFSLLSAINSLSLVLFYLGIALGVVRLLWVSIFALAHRRRELRRAGLDWKPASVAVIIPAYNEGTVIERSIASILASDYEDFRVVVVDDGSTDDTSAIVEQRFGGDPRVTLLRKPNGGKWSALNHALRTIDAEVVVTLDADTIFARDAVRLLVRHFADPRIAAVAGHAMIGNKINLLTRFQAIEYITNQNLDRRALEMVNGITVVPGAIGAWRRQALLDIGGYGSDTLAEDSDATVRLGLAGWKVACEPAAVARTEAPETIAEFMKQRHRWMFGTLQVASKAVWSLNRNSPKGLALLGLPNILVFQFAFTLVAPLIDLIFVWSLLSGFGRYLLSPEAGVPPAMLTVALYWLCFQMLEIAVGVLGVALDRRPGEWRLLWVLMLQRFFYRQLLYITAWRVLLAAFRGTLQGWGKLARTGSVSITEHA